MMGDENKDVLGDEIDDLLEGLGDLEEEEGGEGDDTPPSGDETPPDDTPPPDDESGSGDESPTDESGDDTPPPDGDEPPEDDDIPDDKDKLIETLRGTINELSGGRISVDDGGHVSTKPKEDEEPAAPPATPPKDDEPLEIEKLQFIKEDDNLDDILEDGQKLNELLNLVLQKAVEVAVPAVHQRTVQSIPSVVHEYSKRRGAVNEIVSKFYEKNDDLVPFRKAVAAAANTVHSENPDWDYKQVFDEAAERTRNALGLKAKVKSGSGKSKDTGLSRKKGGGRSTQRLTGISSEINDFEGL
jgi:hypothetical protein